MAKSKKKRLYAYLTEEQVYHIELAAQKLGLRVCEFVRSVLVQKARETMDGPRE